MMRLTRFELSNVIEDALGVDASEALDSLGSDGVAAGFIANANSPLGADATERHREFAETLASQIDVESVFGCVEDGCADEAVMDVGRRLFRRPLFDDEVSRFRRLYDLGRDSGALDLSPSGALRLVAEAMLQSPWFLIRGEESVASAGPGTAPLNGFELATRLSFFLWRSSPDEALLTEAASGRLETEDGYRAAVQRLMDDPRSERGLADFHYQWLWLRKAGEKEAPSQIDPATLESLERSARSFVVNAVREGSFEDLFTSNMGLEGPGRSGILTHPYLLVHYIHGTERFSPVPLGHLVRERVLCEPLPSPPANVASPESDDSLSDRELAALHSEDPACGGCHRMMDPLGFGFTRYDNTGRFRNTTEDGEPIDASGEIVASRLTPPSIVGPFDGAVELSARLASSEAVQACYVRQLMRYSLGREPSDEDACSTYRIVERFESSGFSLRELFAAVAESDAFRYRQNRSDDLEEMCR